MVDAWCSGPCPTMCSRALLGMCVNHPPSGIQLYNGLAVKAVDFEVAQIQVRTLTLLLTAFQPFSSVQFCHSVVSNSWQLHGLQHSRLPRPSPTPGACSNSCTLSWGFHPTILSSVVPFSSCLQSCPASGSFQMSQFFSSGGQSVGVSASASVLPMNIQD